MTDIPVLDQVTGAVRLALGLTRHSRLRSQIRDSLDLRQMAKDQGLDEVAEDLSAIIGLQTKKLRTVMTATTPFKPQWDVALITLILALICGLIAFFVGVRNTQNGWGYLIAVPFFLGAALFLLTAIVAVTTKPAVIT